MSVPMCGSIISIYSETGYYSYLKFKEAYGLRMTHFHSFQESILDKISKTPILREDQNYPELRFPELSIITLFSWWRSSVRQVAGRFSPTRHYLLNMQGIKSAMFSCHVPVRSAWQCDSSHTP